MTDVREDFDLLVAWRGGDDGAGTVLYERYANGVCRFFMGKVVADTVAEDLAQRTWLAVVEGRDRIRNEGSFRSYLFGVAHNLFREELRRGVRAPIDASITSAHDLGPTATGLIGTIQQNRILLEALRRIPLQSQIMYQLRYWEGLTVPEIAMVVGECENTMKTRLRRGLELLEHEIAVLTAAKANGGLESTSTTLEQWATKLRGLIRRPARGKRAGQRSEPPVR